MPGRVGGSRVAAVSGLRRRLRRSLRSDALAALAAGAVACALAVASGAAAERVRPVAAPATLDAASADLVARRVSAAHADVTAVWRHDFRWRLGRDYRPTELVHFSGRRPSPCAGRGGVTGLAYCPLDRTMSVDLAFLARLAERMRSESDRALVLLVARTEAAHVQAELKILGDADRLARGMTDAERAELDEAVVLQGDCMTGVWAQRARRQIGAVPEARGSGPWRRCVPPPPRQRGTRVSTSPRPKRAERPSRSATRRGSSATACPLGSPACSADDRCASALRRDPRLQSQAAPRTPELSPCRLRASRVRKRPPKTWAATRGGTVS
jgi:hypothetical protein